MAKRKKESSALPKKTKKSSTQKIEAAPHSLPPPQQNFPIVGIGASAGGYEAFVALLRKIPSDTGMAFIFVIHQSPSYETNMPLLLKKHSSMPVVLTKENARIEANTVYVIPSDQDVRIVDGYLHLRARAPHSGGMHLPIDDFFRSLSEFGKKSAIGVILSGTGSDGTAGLEAIKVRGGITFAQDEKSAKYSGMPHSAAASDIVDFVLPPEQIAAEIVRIARHPLMNGEAPEDRLTKNTADLTQLFTLLRKSSGVDFTHYKPSTIARRLTRRMLLHKMETLGQYVLFLKENPKFIHPLYEDLLINVTSFFRDPEVFESLKTEIYPKMLRNGPNKIVRVWVPGCSSGEEAYSIAITMLEYLRERPRNINLQIFATDVRESAIDRSRAGIYPHSISEEVSPERLQKYFIKVEKGYQIAKFVRDLCIFARHNVISDPPFSRIDLISCRNLLIYLGPILQRRIIPAFHYALNRDGYLILGSSETMPGFADYFFPADRKRKIYSKKVVSSRAFLDTGEQFQVEAMMTGPAFRSETASITEKDILKEGDRIILSRYAPASVIVNENFDILQFRGETGDFLQPAPGKASFNIMRMVKEGLTAELRSVLMKAAKDKVSVRKENLALQLDGNRVKLNLEVVPFTVPHTNTYHYIVFFQIVRSELPRSTLKPRSRTRVQQETEITQLRSELQATKDYLQSIIEEQEVSNEELRAANEEILSSNEELQSTNEEMETAKEELQSANEELTTVNEELQVRYAELSNLTNDLTNLLASVYIPIVMLDHDLQIRRFTPAAEKALRLIRADVGRSISDVNLNLRISALPEMVLEVIREGEIKQIEAQDQQGRWYSIQVRPYRTNEHKIEGAVLVFLDVDSLKKSLKLPTLREYFQRIGNVLFEPFAVLDSTYRIMTANSLFQTMFEFDGDFLEGKTVFELMGGNSNSNELRSYLESVLQSEREEAEEYKIRSGKRILSFRAVRLDLHDRQQLIAMTVQSA